ncbi:unnamed protein product [Caenorhabditis angaria]|uniref:Uncharacterized protein n=1 Tax=Caenorhabditis angaria TaxID=860376 RepID=A0A9P1MZE4_9PELO|nr:unnamed protein product [Caenorhabditis angaria]
MILLSEQGYYEVVPPIVFGLEVRNIAFLLLLLDNLGFLIFWLNTIGYLSYFLLFAVGWNLGFLQVYRGMKFVDILFHHMMNLVYLVLLAVFVALIELDIVVCHINRCKRMSDIFEDFGSKLNFPWIYAFCIFTIHTHCLMMCCSWVLMKFAAAKQELEQVAIDMQRRRGLNDIL